MHAAVIAGPRQAGARGVHAGRAGWPSAAERASPASVRAARKSREHRARHHPARMQLTEHGSPHLQGGYGAAAEGARCIVADVIRRATCAFGRRNSPQAALLQRRLVRPGCAERFLSTRWRDSVRVRQLPATLFQPFLTKSSAAELHEESIATRLRSTDHAQRLYSDDPNSDKKTHSQNTASVLGRHTITCSSASSNSWIVYDTGPAWETVQCVQRLRLARAGKRRCILCSS
jgi:hypothetical protein